MKLSYTNFKFTIGQIKSLLIARKINEDTLLNFTHIIDDILINNTKSKIKCLAFQQDEQSQKKNDYNYNFVKSLFYHVKISFKLLNQIKKKSKILIYGIDPNRLHINKKKTLRKNIILHTSYKSKEIKNCFEEIDYEWNEIIFDPKLNFHYRSLDNINMPVLSPISVIIIGLLRFWVINPFNVIKILTRLFLDISPKYSSFKDKLLSPFLILGFLLGFSAILSFNKQVKLLCLTSNSTFLEILRALIVSLPTGKTLEILHGIITPIFNDYYLSYKKVLSERKLTNFIIIPMLKPPFSLKPVNYGGYKISQNPSNTGIYKVLKSLIEKNSPLTKPINLKNSEILVQMIYEKLSSYEFNKKPIFSILGGTGLNDDYYNSLAFNVEFELLEKIRQQFLKLHNEPTFIYFPHPNNYQLKTLTFSDGKKIHIAQDTQISYFYADYCFGLYSSSIFEAAAFGVNVFSPITLKSHLFYPEMLQRITIPQNRTLKSLDKSINDFVNKKVVNDLNHKEKIYERVNHFLLGKI